MSITFTIYEKTGNTFARSPRRPEEASTFQSDHYMLNKAAAVAIANSIIRDAQLPEIGDDYSDEEEVAWNTFFAQPRVKAELERLAEEAERQFAAETTS